MTWVVEWYQESPFSTAMWVDWLDILLLAWLIYRGLMLIRGTRALQSLFGLALLGLVYVASDVLGLSTLHWILDNLFVYLILALLILFQEDIRRALARAGGTIFRETSRPSDANLMEEIIQGVFNLANRKVGALIALERTAGLGPYITGAHTLEAQVSAELLQSIFHPSSPIHDGAIVISGDRILAAGVFLPISLSKDISKSYGTRHRAAIGLTEATDAICLVVSEERGTVAMVQNGAITPIADQDDLREKLLSGLESQPSQAESQVGAASA